MPQKFVQCVKRGGRVRTKRLKKNRYVRLCFKGGRSFTGEVKRRKQK